MLRLVRVFIGFARSVDLHCLAVHSLISLVLILLQNLSPIVVDAMISCRFDLFLTAICNSVRSGLRKLGVWITRSGWNRWACRGQHLLI
ncbi:hypothetical protein HID58_045540 [Brassica napus]|uniref:Secreted protein n=3 Tax=Brassica TaxID=3705 RepID=A0ABQ8AUM9_BRANA|nr:hypothetical protein HID58_045540 [Brassica napus]CAF2369140.1 unnamed protein product [Brassica napus]CDY63779.1 BnaCnng42660D [Brassica napus]